MPDSKAAASGGRPEESGSFRALRIAGYTFSYHSDKPVLDEVDLEVDPGERLALLGPNGAGKSTLLLAIAGFFEGRGLVEVLGMPVKGRNINGIRRKTGFLFQDPDDQLFMPTVLDNVAFGPLNLGFDKRAARERSSAALKEVGLPGFEPVLAHHLSQGQKRLVALAAVLAMEPTIYLLDEPSAFLDPRGKANLAALVRRLDATLLVASHDIEFVRAVCSAAAVLDGGRIVARGPIERILEDRDLLESAGLYGNLYG